MEHRLDEHILNLLEEHGEMHTRDIYKTLPDERSNLKKRLGMLRRDGKVEMHPRSVYRLLSESKAAATNPKTQFRQTRKKFSKDARSAEDNAQTINALLNTYDEVLALFQTWVLTNIISQDIDFAQQLLFIDNFKWLTTIVDKLMKRWSLVHHGYDSNSRQAQEDAKAKTEERQKKALEDAPLEETLHVVGHYHTDLKKLWDQPLDPEQEELPDPEQEAPSEPEQEAPSEPEQEKRNI